MPPLCGQVFKFHATLFNVAQNTKIKAANDSARREEFKTALKFFLGGLGFPQTEIEVALTGVCPPPTFRDVPTPMQNINSIDKHT